MTGSRRVARLAWGGFLLTAVLIIVGMAWATHVTSRLDRLEQVRAEHERKDARLHMAVWRMDNLVTSLLATEAGRPYSHYSSYYPATDPLYASLTPIEPPGTVWLASPLLFNKPDWVDVYFQVSPEGHWSSPELPMSSPARFPRFVDARYSRIHAMLADLESRLTPDDLLDRMVETESYSNPGDRAGRTEAPDAAGRSDRTSRGNASRLASTRDDHRGVRDFERRRSAADLAFQNLLPPETCAPTDIVSHSMNPGLEAAEEVCLCPSMDRVSVRLSLMRPVWITHPGEPDQKLAFVRTATIDGRDYYQGFVVDWARFSKLLLERIADAYPDASLTRVFAGSAFEPRTWLTAIPASLTLGTTAGTAAAVMSSSQRWLLVLSWGTAVTALVGLGLGVRNLVSLAHRRVQFAYAVAHELRTPLTTFRLYTDMLASGLVPESSRQDYLDTLNRESRRLGDLVNGVLEYARLENRAVRLNVRSVGGADLIERLTTDFDRSCTDEGVRFTARNSLPEDCRIQTDVDLLMCIVGVLVANGTRHAKSAETPEVRVELERVNGHLCLGVIDNGPGIDAGDERNIYRPFRSGRHGDPSARGGLGLGLSLARKWAKLLGGRLELAQRKHPTFGGAAFRVSVPYQTGHAAGS